MQTPQVLVKGYSPEGREFFVARSALGRLMMLRDEPYPLERPEAEKILVEATRAAPCATYVLVKGGR